MTPGFKKASKLTAIFASVAAMSLTGCTTMSPLNGQEQQNTQSCMKFEQAQATAASLKKGTPKAEVYAAFNIAGDQMVKRMNKDEVYHAVYGQTVVNIPFAEKEKAQEFLNGLEGRSLVCQDINTRRSFSWTHSTNTKDGYQYTLTFVFQNGTLYDPVAVQGEPVHQKSNNGYLNNFNPLDSVSRAARF